MTTPAKFKFLDISKKEWVEANSDEVYVVDEICRVILFKVKDSHYDGDSNCWGLIECPHLQAVDYTGYKDFYAGDVGEDQYGTRYLICRDGEYDNQFIAVNISATYFKYELGELDNIGFKKLGSSCTHPKLLAVVVNENH